MSGLGVLGVICAVCGFFGAICCFAGAWSLRDNKIWLKRLVISGIICIVVLLIGIVMLMPDVSSISSSSGSSSGSSSKSSSSSSKCKNCGRSPTYDLGYCKTCYKGFMNYTYGD